MNSLSIVIVGETVRISGGVKGGFLPTCDWVPISAGCRGPCHRISHWRHHDACQGCRWWKGLDSCPDSAEGVFVGCRGTRLCTVSQNFRTWHTPHCHSVHAGCAPQDPSPALQSHAMN